MPRWVLRCSCCNYWDMLYMYCCGGREEQQMMLWTNCVCVVCRWPEGRWEGGGLPTNIHMRKKGKAWLRERAGGRERTGIMASIQRACRVENQWGPKRKGKTEILGDGRRRRMKGSVFILVQVSLFVKVFVFWRRKTFLQSQFNQGYWGEASVLAEKADFFLKIWIVV